MDDINPENWLSLRLRKGAKATWLSSSPSRPATTVASGKASQMDNPACLNQPQSYQAAEGEDGRVGEVQYIEHAEDQRIAHREQPVHAAYEQAVDQLLEKYAHRYSLTALVAQHHELSAFDLLDYAGVVRIAALGKRETAQHGIEVLDLDQGVAKCLSIAPPPDAFAA